MTETDEFLAGRAQRGDDAAFDRLVGRYQGAVYHLALRYRGHAEDARELAQDVFLRVYRKLSAYDPSRPFRPWLYTLAARVMLNARAARPPATVSLSQDDHAAFEPAAPPHEDPARIAEGRSLQAAVHQALLELPPAYRLAMLLRHLKQLSYDEIATTLELPVGTVKTHLHRARNRLREVLTEQLPADLGDRP